MSVFLRQKCVTIIFQSSRCVWWDSEMRSYFSEHSTCIEHISVFSTLVTNPNIKYEKRVGNIAVDAYNIMLLYNTNAVININQITNLFCKYAYTYTNNN